MILVCADSSLIHNYNIQKQLGCTRIKLWVVLVSKKIPVISNYELQRTCYIVCDVDFN